MKLLVMTPANLSPAPEFIESLELLGLPWVRHGFHAPLPVMHSAYRFTHILWTNSAYSFLTWDERSIHAAYSFVGSPPCLFSTHRDLDPPKYEPVQHRTHRRIYRDICTGSFMGEILYLHKNMDRFSRGELERRDYKGERGVKLDKECEVFQNMGAEGHKDVSWDTGEGFFYNNATKSNPCVMSFTEGRPGISRFFKLWRQRQRKQMARKAQALGRELSP